MASIIQPSMAGGEVSPQIGARVDLSKRAVAVELAENFMATFTGAMMSRPGTRFVARAKPGAGPHRIIERWSDSLVNIHIDDARGNEHEHLMPGEGEIDFGPIMQAIESLPSAPFISVELSRHGHDAVEAARRAHAFLIQRW